MESINIKSPDKEKEVTFSYLGEIRFGPVYYSMQVGTLQFKDRYFSYNGIWSPDSSLFAVEEWLTIREVEGPKMRLVIIDVKQNKEAVISLVNKGFFYPIRIQDDKIIYRKDFRSMGLVKEFEVIISEIKNWTNIDVK
ncbi:hypothetical protein [Robertmurraya sp. Marseille-Q9965]